MFIKRYFIGRATGMGCCGCFGFSLAKRSKKMTRPTVPYGNRLSHELLLDEDIEEDEDCSYNGDMTDASDDGDVTDSGNGDDGELPVTIKRSEDIILYRTQNGLICREFPVKETRTVIRSEVHFVIYMKLSVIINIRFSGMLEISK